MRLRRRPSAAPRRAQRRIRKFRLFALLSVLSVLGLTSFTFGLVTAVASQIPTLGSSSQVEREVNSYLYNQNGDRILAVLRGSQNRVLVPSEDIAPVMKHAIVAVEDRRFFDHRGVDIRAIGRAFLADVRNQRVVQGGSTITQQFVKNVYVKDRRSIGRKLKEAALSWQLEQQWSKDKILTEYLNTIYFGNGAYGIEQASRVYFDHSALRLTLPEAALLAGIPADPGRFDPSTNPRTAKSRRDLVLDMMLEQGLVTGAEHGNAKRTALPPPESIRLPGTLTDEAPYFVNYVKQQLIDKYGSGRVFGGGLRVTTTIDLALQDLGRKAIAKWLTDDEGPQAALVAVTPEDGRVVAMIGGSNFRESQFNLAVQGERQPGSSFKPFVLAAALEQGVSPSNTFVSEEIEIDAGGRIWPVENYEGSYLGPIDLRTATIHSDNAVYAQLTQLIGPRSIVDTAHQLGVRSPLNEYFAIGLGAEAVNPLEMARAFSSIARGGTRVDGTAFGNRPRAIIEVKNEAGGMIDDNAPIEKPGIDENTAAMVTDFLQGVVRQGTGRAAALPDGRPVAGKTGTTENHGDAWFVGYTPQLAVAVWVGYPDELRPMLYEFHGDPVAGGTYPALIWKSFMEQALPYLQAEPQGFDPPQIPYSVSKYVVMRDGRLQLDNGSCTNARLVLYFSDGGPRRTADCKPNEVQVPRVVGKRVAAAKDILEASSLRYAIVYKPATARQRLGVVVDQIQADDTLSANDQVTLVLPKPLHGVVPNVVGLPLATAVDKLERARLEVDLPESDDSQARVVSQKPSAGVAAAPGMSVTLAVAAG